MKQSFRNVPWGRLLSVFLAAALLFTGLETPLFVQAAEGGGLAENWHGQRLSHERGL